ncbi:hypothetical protein D9M69_517130 [compost metagenome]
MEPARARSGQEQCGGKHGLTRLHRYQDGDCYQDDLKYPGGCLGQPEDVAALIAYRCSPGAPFLTGANIAINGGQHLLRCGSI